MKLFLKRLGCFILAVVAAAVLSCIASTQFVLAELGALGVDVSLSVRTTTSLYDIVLDPHYETNGFYTCPMPMAR